MNFLREVMEKPAGKVMAAILALVFLAAAIHAVVGLFGSTLPGRMYICTETGKTFSHVDKMGETHPIYSPYSHKDTGVPAEPCYWTAAGKIKAKPTWVLLNSLAGGQEPTFCPECGRLVTKHNSSPSPGDEPPPTREMYEAQHKGE